MILLKLKLTREERQATHTESCKKKCTLLKNFTVSSGGEGGGGVRRETHRKVMLLLKFDIHQKSLGPGDGGPALVPAPSALDRTPHQHLLGLSWFTKLPFPPGSLAEKEWTLGTASRSQEIDEDIDKGMNTGPAVTFSVCCIEVLGLCSSELNSWPSSPGRRRGRSAQTAALCKGKQLGL